MPAGFDPLVPDHDRDGIVQLQAEYRYPANGCLTDDARAVCGPLEMLRPALAARVEQPDPLPCFGIGPLGLIALESVAQPAGEPEVIFFVRAAGPMGDNVVDLQPSQDQV